MNTSRPTNASSSSDQAADNNDLRIAKYTASDCATGKNTHASAFQTLTDFRFRRGAPCTMVSHHRNEVKSITTWVWFQVATCNRFPHNSPTTHRNKQYVPHFFDRWSMRSNPPQLNSSLGLSQQGRSAVFEINRRNWSDILFVTKNQFFDWTKAVSSLRRNDEIYVCNITSAQLVPSGPWTGCGFGTPVELTDDHHCAETANPSG